MNDEQLHHLDIARKKNSHQEQKELIREFADLRQLLNNPYASMEVYVLEPICERCRYGRSPMEAGDMFLPLCYPIHPSRENCYMYPAQVERGQYAPEQGIIMRRNAGHEILCVNCEEDLTEETMLFVQERRFQEYFCLTDKAKGLPLWLRKHILNCYGQRCFNCKNELSAKTLTIDHIVPQAKGEDDRPTNPQAYLCVMQPKEEGRKPRKSLYFSRFSNQTCADRCVSRANLVGTGNVLSPYYSP